jgi:hypothetical protein
MVLSVVVLFVIGVLFPRACGFLRYAGLAWEHVSEADNSNALPSVEASVDTVPYFGVDFVPAVS